MHNTLCALGLCETCARSQDEVRAFYGDAYNYMMQAEREKREHERIKRERLPDMVDDVASQVQE